MPGRGTGNKNRRPREPGGALDQQTFIDLAEDRDCARGVFIVIEAAMSAGGAGSLREFMGAFQWPT